MEKPKRSKSTLRSNTSLSSNLTLDSSYIVSKPNIQRTKSAKSYVIEQKYQQPIVLLYKPKELTGPFNVYNIPYIRDTLRSYRENSTNRKKQVEELNAKIFDELELNDYFSKKSNWVHKSKFISTNSFLSAVQIYLPAKSNNLASFNKFKELKKQRENVSDKLLPNIYKF